MSPLNTLAAPFRLCLGRIRRWRKALLVLAALVLAGVGFVLASRAYVLHVGEKRVEAAVAEADSLDPGWRWEEQLAAREVIPEDQNSAPHVLAAAALLPKGWPNTPAHRPSKAADQAAPHPFRPGPELTLPERLSQIDPVRQLDAQFVSELQVELEALGPALEKARPVANLSKGRYTVAWDRLWFNTRLDHAQEARRLSDLLRLQAARLAQENRTEDALTFTRAILNAGRSLGDEPTLISQLVRIAIGGLAVRTLERMLAQGEASPQQLAGLQGLLAEEVSATQPLIVNALRGERALAFESWNLLAEGAISFEDFNKLRQPRPLAWYQRLWEWVYVPPLARLNQAEYLRSMTRLVAIAELPYAEQAQEYKEFEEDLKEQQASAPQLALGFLFIPTLSKITAARQRHEAWLNCAAVALAAERYRLEHGQWPEALDQLVPAFLEQVPADPFGKSPLHYRRLADGIIIYSVGPDGQDDHGTLDRTDPRKPGTDVGFQLWDVPHRRQPAVEPDPPVPTPPRQNSRPRNSEK